MKYTGTLTYSKISTFNRCRKLFYDQYIKMAGFTRSQALERGSKIHEWIASILINSAIPEISVGLNLDKQNVTFIVQKIAEIKQKAKKIYVETNFALGHDLVSLVPYNSDSFIRGTFDLVSENEDGTILLVDWKSGESRPDDMQIQLYSWILRKVYPLRPIQCQYICVDKCKVIEVENIDIEDNIKKIRHDVYEEEEWKPEPGWYCSFCPHVVYRYEKDGQEITEATYKRLKRAKEKVQKIEISRPKECGNVEEKVNLVDISIEDFLKTYS